MESYQIVIVGAGISGATLAERFASIGKRVLVVEKRSHVGGNCYDYRNDDGLLIAKYGAHLFHTKFEDVWEYVNRFSEWVPYEHRVLSRVDGMLVPVPVNITTVNAVLGLNIKDEAEMVQWLHSVQVAIPDPKNSEEVALSRVGTVLYEKMFKNYTFKQWGKYPKELGPSVLARIPVRTNFDDRYFSDRYEARPKNGYTEIFKKMLSHPNITVVLDTDFFDVQSQVGGYEKLFYTGPIDRYFGYEISHGAKLEYRSINFVLETYDKEFYQQSYVVNYPNEELFTRIVEHKHYSGQKNPRTTISKEYSTDEGEPYYPVPNPRNGEVFARYKQEADRLTKDGVYFVGRLATYRYINMDEAFKNSLDLFASITGLPADSSG